MAGPLLIVINNYLHDLATGVLFGSAVVMLAVLRWAGTSTAEQRAVVGRLVRPLERTAAGALAWVLIAGVPRTIFFKEYELLPAVERAIVPALLVKHVILFAAVAFGIVVWRRVVRLVRSWERSDVDADA